MTQVDAGERSAGQLPTSEPAPLTGKELARFVWRQLTSMRTALVLLFLLALTAIPGSLLPQRNISPIRVQDFIKQHPLLGPLYDKVGLFAVYTSPWFSAVYLLLFLSLVGCIIPRTIAHARSLRRPPPPAPRHLHRLPAYRQWTTTDRPGDTIDRAAQQLRRRHYRVVVTADTVAAERGYLRESGNLIFHLSLLLLLAGVATGVLLGYRGSVVAIVGQGFSNNVTQYDDLAAGAWVSSEDLRPFTVEVKDFEVRFETGPVQRGAARLFRADLSVTDSTGTAPREVRLEVNKPLRVAGTTVHLIGHGYAPKVTVRDGAGNVAFSGPIVFLPQDGNFTSAGVIKVPDARPDRLAFQGIFTPTSVLEQGPRSAFPDAFLPALYINAFAGPPATETGIPESIYQLNQTGLTQLRNPDGSAFAARLTPGDILTLPDGKGSIQFDGWTRWVKLQVGTTPGASLVLVAVLLAVAGLCLSLFVRPRRLWVRGKTDPDGQLVEVAGLDRADARSGLMDEIDQLAAGLQSPASVDQPADREVNR